MVNKKKCKIKRGGGFAAPWKYLKPRFFRKKKKSARYKIPRIKVRGLWSSVIESL